MHQLCQGASKQSLTRKCSALLHMRQLETIFATTQQRATATFANHCLSNRPGVGPVPNSSTRMSPAPESMSHHAPGDTKDVLVLHAEKVTALQIGLNKSTMSRLPNVARIDRVLYFVSTAGVHNYGLLSQLQAPCHGFDARDPNAQDHVLWSNICGPRRSDTTLCCHDLPPRFLPGTESICAIAVRILSLSSATSN